jgi:hypothetical protein
MANGQTVENQAAENEWDAIQNGSSEPSCRVCVLPPSVLSIFRRFYGGSDTETFYCFKRFHAQPDADCLSQDVGCSIRYVDGIEREFRCAHGIDHFDTLIDSIVNEMWAIDGRSGLTVEVMQQQIKNMLYTIRLVKARDDDKDNGAHKAIRYGDNSGSIDNGGISINVHRGITNQSYENDPTSAIKYVESANSGKLLRSLIARQGDAISGEIDSIVENKLISVLIHELRHIWQMVQYKLSPNSETGMWMRKDTNKTIDIMTEVDAFEIQRLFEKRRSIVANSGASIRFEDIEKNRDFSADRKIMEKAKFLWDIYKYGKMQNERNQFMFRNSFGLMYPPSNTTQNAP